MKLMGRHSPPLDGVTVANGHHLAPFTIPSALLVPPRGPVSGWPQPVAPGWWQRQRQSVSAHGDAYRAVLAAVPVILVNVVAFGAQLGFWYAHLHNLAQAVLVSLALESIAIYLSWHAHLAQLADDAALRLRLAAYGMALGIGALNYSHFDGPGWRPTVPAVTFGMMSAISPWLWSVHSRRASRDALKARGLIEPHAVRLGATRWQWHPLRSWRVMFRATWIGETDPTAAIALIAPPEPSVDTTDDGVADPSPAGPDTRQEAVSEDAETASAPPSDDATAEVRSASRRTARPPSARARALAALTANPRLTDAEVMKRAKVSESTAQRARRELAKASS